MHIHSLEAYNSIIEALPSARAKVFHFLKEREGLTRQELAFASHIPLSSICGRIKELIDLGVVEEDGCEIVKVGSHATKRAKLFTKKPTEFVEKKLVEGFREPEQGVFILDKFYPW